MASLEARVALTRTCNTSLLKTTYHGYYSNPCFVPLPVPLARLWHSEHAYKGLPPGKLLPPKHEAMFCPNPRGSGKVWMMLTSEYTLIIKYYVNQTWVNRQGFWWGCRQGQIRQMPMCILWAVDEKPCSQLQNGLYPRFLRGQTRHILIRPSNFNLNWMWSVNTSF